MITDALRSTRFVLAVTPLLLSLPLADVRAQVQISIDSSANVRTISPYIYGTNIGNTTRPFARLGGNRWTAYNWENNASNAGSDWFHQNDGYLSNSNTPGAAVRPAIQWAGQQNQALLVTVPINGYVAADKNGGGDVNQTPNYLQTRFKQELPKKGSAFTTTPSTADGFVYQDEFVNWVETSARVNSQQQIFYGLDNEPDLWKSTHARIHPNAVTYAELAQKTIDYADAIKDVKSDAVVFGAVNYGWSGYRTLQDAPDAAGRDFHRFFLEQMKTAETTYGHRLVDALDIHWYPEAQGGGVRITGSETSSAVVEARVQAARSLWDPTYTEASWITQWSTLGPIKLLPRVQQDIDTYYPHTKIAITEYNYGAGNHISGGIAQADVLGVFGREGVFAANWWDLGNGSSFVNAAMDMYLNYDGAGGRFGDRSIRATTANNASTAVYASVDASDPNRMVVVLINRTASAVTTNVSIDHDRPLTKAEVYRLAGASANIAHAGDVLLASANNLSSFSLPAYSVTTLELSALAGDENGDGAVDIFDVNTISDHWGSAGALGDANSDGVVDIFDVNVVSDHWGDNWTSGATSVPEPASAATLIVVATMLGPLAVWHKALGARGRAQRRPGSSDRFRDAVLTRSH